MEKGLAVVAMSGDQARAVTTVEKTKSVVSLNKGSSFAVATGLCGTSIVTVHPSAQG